MLQKVALSAIPLRLFLDLDDPPQKQGALPTSSAIMAVTLLALPVLLSSYTFIRPPHPLSLQAVTSYDDNVLLL